MALKFDKGTRNLFKTLFQTKLRKEVTLDDLIFFTDQMAAMYKAGFTLGATLSALEEQTDCEPLKNALFSISFDLQIGVALSKCLTNYPEIFPEYYVKNIYAAEIGGVMDETLRNISNYLRAEKKLKLQVRKTTLYPKIVFGVILFGMYIFYKINFVEDVFSAGGLITFLASEVFSLQNFILMAIVILAYILALDMGTTFLTRGKGKNFWDRFRLNMWGLKNTYIMSLNKKFAELFIALYNSGLHITEVFNLIADAMGNRIYGKELLFASERIGEGMKVSEAIAQCRFINITLKNFFHNSESTGELDKNLAYYVKQQEGEIERNLKKIMVNFYIAIMLFLFIMFGQFRTMAGM